MQGLEAQLHNIEGTPDADEKVRLEEKLASWWKDWEEVERRMEMKGACVLGENGKQVAEAEHSDVGQDTGEDTGEDTGDDNSYGELSHSGHGVNPAHPSTPRMTPTSEDVEWTDLRNTEDSIF